MVNKLLVFKDTKSYFNIRKFQIGFKLLQLLILCCSLIYYSCASKGYEIEEVQVEEEIPDTQKTVASDKYEAPKENLYEKELKKESSEFETPFKGLFSVQIGAFIDESKAASLLNSAKYINNDVYYKLINGLYKVRVGEFLARTDAMILLEKLKKNGFNDAFIIEK